MKKIQISENYDTYRNRYEQIIERDNKFANILIIYKYLLLSCIQNKDHAEAKETAATSNIVQ